MSVVIETTIGDITVDLYLKERPNTCLNFLKLCKIKYYNLCVFYKIEKNFIAQTGDPTATGRGGESVFCHLYGDQAKYFDAEFKPRLKHEKLGTLSMVNNGNNMNGSQFFLTLSEKLTYLDEDHVVFGEVVEGFDVLSKLNDAICDTSNRPYQDIRITHTVVLHDPFENPKGLEIPDASPEPTKEMLESNYIGADEEIDDSKGKTTEEIEEKIKDSEAKARATILEMVGDIPDADVKPPENVLFVCKLNPVTTSEDLEIIFSRFGKILSCEVIKDKKTGDSLQYAFIEFEKEEDCEAAYFKMDNVLIDDRRIHVDFSQSVSKLNPDKEKFQNKSVKSNFSLKTTERNDGYDLIFDMDDSTAVKSGKHKSRSNDPEKKEKKKHSEKSNERKYKDDYDSRKDRVRYSDSYSKSKSRHLEQNSSRKYREYEYYKESPESFSRHYKALEKKHRHESLSPDRQKKFSSKYKHESHEHYSKSKYSGKYDHHEYKSRNKSSREIEKDRTDSTSHRFKNDTPKKIHSTEKSKKSKRKSPVSSSSSSTDSDSSSSSSSSDNARKKKYHHKKQKEVSIAHNKKTSHKKRKYNT